MNSKPSQEFFDGFTDDLEGLTERQLVSRAYTIYGMMHARQIDSDNFALILTIISMKLGWEATETALDEWYSRNK